jgi:CBS domain-containing protein
MIIRIMGEGQYRVDSCLLDDLNKIDNRIVDHVSKGDLKKFKKDLVQMISTIKEKGEPLDPVEIMPSDIIVPPEDLTMDEARRVFSGHGLIED